MKEKVKNPQRKTIKKLFFIFYFLVWVNSLL